MLRLRDIMSTAMTTVSSHATLREAAAVLTRHCVSGAPVMDNGAIVGVLSASDILAFAGSEEESADALLALVGEQPDHVKADSGRQLGAHTAAEAMSRKLWALDADDDVILAAQLMARNHIHRLFVTSNGELRGIVTTSDVTRALADGRVR